MCDFRPFEQDHFRIRVTTDVVDKNGNLQTNEVRSALYEPVQSTHRIGEFTALPDQFYFREFGGNMEEDVLGIIFIHPSNFYVKYVPILVYCKY